MPTTRSKKAGTGATKDWEKSEEEMLKHMFTVEQVHWKQVIVMIGYKNKNIIIIVLQRCFETTSTVNMLRKMALLDFIIKRD